MPLFDYNDEILTARVRRRFEEKPDGSALVPPRVVFQPGTPYRASDHDPVIVGLFSDTTPPDTTIDSNPPDPSASGDPTFTFSGTDDVTPSVDLTFECDLDGGGFSDCSSPQDYTGLGDGSHTSRSGRSTLRQRTAQGFVRHWHQDRRRIDPWSGAGTHRNWCGLVWCGSV